jgi:hypothetical protein
MQLRLRSSFSFLTLALIPLLSACPSSDDDGHEEEVGETVGTDETEGTTESGTDESGTDDASTTDESTTDESTSDESTEDTGTEDTGTEETATDTEETDTGTEETGDPSLNEQLCMDACAVFVDCVGGGGPNCVDSCIEYHDELEGACLGFEQELTGCIAGLTCNELDQLLEEFPEPYPCQTEQEQICEAPICEAGVGGGEEPGECSFQYSCPDEPVYEVVCDGDSCTCLEDGVEVGGCSEAVDFCEEVGEPGPANDCCGWDL